MSRFGQEDHASWFYTPDGGFESYFVHDGYGNRVIYDQKGNWLFSLIVYREAKLPRNIRNQVKSTYFDFDIVVAEELQMYEGIEYIITLKNQSEIMTVRVDRQGDLEVLQELNQ
jgi:hypothetical protein